MQLQCKGIIFKHIAAMIVYSFKTVKPVKARRIELPPAYSELAFKKAV